MAGAVSLEPFRIGMTLLLLNRPRLALQLLIFLAGGFAMGITVGPIVLFVLRPASGSAHFTCRGADRGRGGGARQRRAISGLLGKARDDRRVGAIETRARQLLNSRSLWTAGVARLGIALPSVDYVAALTLIVASGAAATIQVGALMMFQRGGLRARRSPAALTNLRRSAPRNAGGAV